MGPPQRRQLAAFDADGFLVRAFPFPNQDSDDDGSQNNALSTPTDDGNAISTSIALDSATTETVNGDGDTLSLVVVSTVYNGGSDSEPQVTSYSATSAALPTTTTTPPSTSQSTSSSETATALTSTPTSSAAQAGETSSSSPTPVPMYEHHDSGLSDGSLAAAIVVPVVVFLALVGLLLFFCFRRRRQQQRGERDGSLGAAFIPSSIKEKWSSMRTSSTSARHQEPIVTNTQNNAYNTGLDTSSHGSGDRSQQHSGEYTPGRRSEGGTTFVQPPPPYAQTPTLPQMAHSTPLNMSFDLARNRDVSPHSHPRSPLSHINDPPSAAALLAMPLDPPQPSSRSARSITSTLYSDTASVHSARAARMSVGGPHVINPNSRSQSGSGESGSGSGGVGLDPFDTEANTPITPLSTRTDPEPVSPLRDEERR